VQNSSVFVLGIVVQGNSNPGTETMNKTIGIQLVIFSLMLAGLSYLTYAQAPVFAKPTLIAGLAGGTLCLIWGLRAIAGSTGKALTLMTLTPVNFVLLSQVVRGFLGQRGAEPGGLAATVLVTLAFVVSMGMLTRIAYAGVVFEGQAASLATDGAKPKITGKTVAQGTANKRA
jgi:hypothetical protein